MRSARSAQENARPSPRPWKRCLPRSPRAAPTPITSAACVTWRPARKRSAPWNWPPEPAPHQFLRTWMRPRGPGPSRRRWPAMTATHSPASPVVDQDWRRASRLAHAFGAAAAGAFVLLLVLASQFRTQPVPHPVLLAAGSVFAAAGGLAADLVVRPA